MLLSEIGDKEVIDLTKGSRHGSFWDAEMLFNESDGKIKALLVPNLQGKSRFSSGTIAALSRQIYDYYQQ